MFNIFENNYKNYLRKKYIKLKLTECIRLINTDKLIQFLNELMIHCMEHMYIIEHLLIYSYTVYSIYSLAKFS